jgi:DNA-binding XRE family transcriptional regulator
MNEQINKDLRKLREELGLSQLDVAVMLDTSRPTYVRWETDPQLMPIGKYEKFMQEIARLRTLRENEDIE